jgi:hypothetical protein
MKSRIFVAWLLLFSGLTSYLRADEGMWIPLLIEKYNIKIMQEKGFKLSAEDIYSVNKACMKDAVVIFGGGCTGEIISGEGLLITNHHCGYDNIQKHSSLEHDYLRNGFWAMSKEEELPNPGLTVTILKRMEDVTSRVLENVTDNMNPSERDSIISARIDQITAEAVKGTRFSASVRPFYMGNQYFLFVNEIFRDVRLVGAPPSSIGKFGGETDNWIWPRHTGDFSLFRIYAGKDNNPAEFSKDNVPYKPAYFFPVSLKGVKEGDFTMVFGYPGSSAEYVPSYHIDMMKNIVDPAVIDIRTREINIMENAMATDPLIRIQYSPKKNSLANSWKKWQGEILGLERMNTIGQKQEFESRFEDWVNADESRRVKYGNILPQYKELYGEYKNYYLVYNFTNEVFGGADAFGLANSVRTLADLVKSGAPDDAVSKMKNDILHSSDNFFKDYNTETDRKLFVAVMESYGEKLGDNWLAPAYIRYRNEVKGSFESASVKLYAKSVFTDQQRFRRFVEGFSKASLAKLEKDPIYSIVLSASEFISQNVRGEVQSLNSQIQKLNRLYMAAQMEFEKDKIFYPDANFTLRVAYGQVMGYKPRDAVWYDYYTTLKGIMEKDNPEIFDYDVPDRLKELFQKKDFGRYSQNGELPVCFIANNHTTGGNSGSPVINGEGQLIGVNFDRDWEGVASDMDYNPEQSRNISLDIRYALFIIDKFAGAGYLLNEMKIVE